MTIYNPFNHILGSDLDRHSPTLNATYLDNLNKTFRVLGGELAGTDKQNIIANILALLFSPKQKLGMLDYLPFGLLDIALNTCKDFAIGGTLGAFEKLPLWAKVLTAVPCVLLVSLGVVAIFTNVLLRATTFLLAAAVAAIAAVVILPFVTGIASLVRTSKLNIAGNLTGTYEPTHASGYEMWDDKKTTLAKAIFNKCNPVSESHDNRHETCNQVTLINTADADHIIKANGALTHTNEKVANPFHPTDKGTHYQVIIKMRGFEAQAFRSDPFSLDDITNPQNNNPNLAPIKELISLNYGKITDQLNEKSLRIQTIAITR